ncbi:hypothetical protein Pmani_036587 [Petrolisthes manimaculis]|uniref:Chitin-binding type-2 domain-containing protein n=1 Tax=Petrolisthes manimaculis TaxID=1843537 RepID=A0AAE1NI34_9EUCA|nr:hypothetical protein Pmani_036587 [Petrolisthes manimaculis]
MKEGQNEGRQEGQKEGRQEGQNEGRQEGQKEGQEGQKEGRQEGQNEGQMAGRTEGQKEGRLEGQKEGRQEGRTYRQGREQEEEGGRLCSVGQSSVTPWQNKMRSTLLLLLAGLSAVAALPQGLSAVDNNPTLSTFVCEDDGVFADSEQCDMYWECKGGKSTRHYCVDGLVFDHFKGLAGHVDPCDSPFVVDCTDRPFLQEATHPTLECIRRHGTFEDPDPGVCNKYHVCKDGFLEATHTCTGTLQFNPNTGNCEWPHSANRVGCVTTINNCIKDKSFCCTGEEQIDDRGVSNPHPTFAHLEDCQLFYVCLNKVTPQASSCNAGKVFNDFTHLCDFPENVPECDLPAADTVA